MQSRQNIKEGMMDLYHQFGWQNLDSKIKQQKENKFKIQIRIFNLFFSTGNGKKVDDI